MNQLITLFFTFFKIGLFTFGGGYAMIPLIQREAVERKKWITDEDILEIIAIAESTPGPIAINAATFVGYRLGGIPGAFFATFGIVLPSFTIIYCLSSVLRAFQDNVYFEYAFWGIRIGVLALIVKAMIGMIQKVKKNAVSILIIGMAFLLPVIFHVNLIFVIILCGFIGIISSVYVDKFNQKGRNRE